jgi:plasmid segregation protein ParM
MSVNIKRFLVDLGNSFTFALVNGDIDNIIEIPTVVKKLDEETALGFFAEDVEAKDLRKSLLLKYNGDYYLIGDAAEREIGNNKHTLKLHKKSESLISTLMYLASVAVYEAEKGDVSSKEVDIDINYLSTMLPIFELLQTEKFSDITEPFAKRLQQDISFEVVTPGREKQINIKVKESKCYIEGFVSKYALKYDLRLEEKEDIIQKFQNHKTVNVDLGGGTIDMVLLREGLGNPVNRSGFRTITRLPYLKNVVNELTKRLAEYFQHDGERALERFIVNHYKEEKYIWENSITGEKVDLTEQVEKMLRKYTNEMMIEVLDTYEAVGEEIYKFNYFGGVAPILRKFIKENITERFSVERFNEYHHIEPDTTARFLNLYGLEVLARQDTLVNKG